MGIYGLSPEVIGSLTVCELESRATVAALCVRVGLWHDTLDHSPAQMHIQLYELEEILRRIIHEVRGAIFALRAAALEQLGFFAAVRRFISDSAEQNQLHIEVRVLGRENQPSTALQPVLFQIIQEALHNVAKHAQAHDIVGDERPFPPAAARHYAVPIAIGKLNHLEGFADGADLVSLEQHDIGCAYLDSMPQPLRTRRE